MTLVGIYVSIGSPSALSDRFVRNLFSRRGLSQGSWVVKLSGKMRKSLIRHMRNGLQSRLRRFDSDPSLQNLIR
jgi:hypothetical protein